MDEYVGVANSALHACIELAAAITAELPEPLLAEKKRFLCVGKHAQGATDGSESHQKIAAKFPVGEHPPV